MTSERCFSFSRIKLVSGTLRSNLDPFGLHDDARLWDALRRSHLIEQTKQSMELAVDGQSSGTHTPVNRFTLDTIVEDEGGNFSVGQVCVGICRELGTLIHCYYSDPSYPLHVHW